MNGRYWFIGQLIPPPNIEHNLHEPEYVFPTKPWKIPVSGVCFVFRGKSLLSINLLSLISCSELHHDVAIDGYLRLAVGLVCVCASETLHNI